MATRRRRKKKNASNDVSVRRLLHVSVESLEVARGHDGLLRGKPEPTLVLAVYRIGQLSTALIGRFIQQVPVKSAPPCVIPVQSEKFRYSIRPLASERFVVLALAIERDSGAGVTALYSSLETPEAFELWGATEEVPNPRTLRDFGSIEHRAPSAMGVHVLVGARHARDVCKGDDFLSACTLSVPANQRQDEIWRLPFSDESTRNQWTATLRLRLW